MTHSLCTLTVLDTPEPPAPVLTELEKKAVEIAKGYEKLPLQDRIDVIARTFGCTTGKIETSPCREPTLFIT
mgnify:CR=1 FL=1